MQLPNVFTNDSEEIARPSPNRICLSDLQKTKEKLECDLELGRSGARAASLLCYKRAQTVDVLFGIALDAGAELLARGLKKP